MPPGWPCRALHREDLSCALQNDANVRWLCPPLLVLQIECFKVAQMDSLTNALSWESSRVSLYSNQAATSAVVPSRETLGRISFPCFIQPLKTTTCLGPRAIFRASEVASLYPLFPYVSLGPYLCGQDS